ncbi:MAG: helix-turn-helix domain-containing protein [Alphaproteobacteria bacterium]|nr:helix-turn-helix domain-containing protein [Alphaproteobacteria bacterium]
MYSIGVAAERSGVTIETIRYYEREGIVSKPDRTSAGHRIYSDDGIARLRFVKRCRDLGFPIPEAKSLLSLTDGSQTSCSSACAIAEEQRGLVRNKIADLKRMETELSELIGQCPDSEDTCPILEDLLSS